MNVDFSKFKTFYCMSFKICWLLYKINKIMVIRQNSNLF